MGGKPKSRKQFLLDAMHPDWVVLRWHSITARNVMPGIQYAVIGDGYALVNGAWYHETLGWCPLGGHPTTLRLDDLERLVELVKKGETDGR